MLWLVYIVIFKCLYHVCMHAQLSRKEETTKLGVSSANTNTEGLYLGQTLASVLDLHYKSLNCP